jgi:hypothetical protein
VEVSAGGGGGGGGGTTKHRGCRVYSRSWRARDRGEEGLVETQGRGGQAGGSAGLYGRIDCTGPGSRRGFGRYVDACRD